MRWVGVLGFSLLLALIALHQPIARVGTHMTGMPGEVTDYYHFHWNYWWITHALANGLNVYETDYVFAPFISSLALHTLAPFWTPLWWLVKPLAGTFAAMTLAFVLSITFSSAAAIALLRREGAAWGWALVGGAMFAWNSLLFSAIHWSMTSLLGWFWIPVLLLAWGELARAVRSGGARSVVAWGGAIGLTLWAMILTDLQYPIYMGMLLVPYALVTVVQAAGAGARMKLIAGGTLAGALAVVLLWVGGLIPALLAFERGGLAPTPADRAVALRFPFEYFVREAGGQNVAVGFMPAVLLIAAITLRIVRWRKAAPAARVSDAARLPPWGWLALAIVPLILSAGASITIDETTITLPYTAFHQIFGGLFRYPERFLPVFVLAIALFAAPILSRAIPIRGVWRWLPTAALLLVMIDVRAFRSIALQPQPTRYAFYEQMGREPYDYVVLEVPTGASSGEGIVGISEYSAFQFYGTDHGKRMINGHLSRVNIGHYWHMRTDDPMLAWLGQRRLLESDAVREQMASRINDYPIGYAVIHREWIEPYGSTQQEVIGFFNQLDDLWCPYAVEGTAVVYRSRWHPDGCTPRIPPPDETGAVIIDVGSVDDVRYLGWGWHPAERIAGLGLRWTGEYPQADVYADLEPGAYTITLRAQSFWDARRVRMLVNGVPATPIAQVGATIDGDGMVVTVEALHDYSFAIDAFAVGSGQHTTITLAYDATIVPVQVGQSADTRRLAVAVDQIVLRLTYP